MLIAAGPAGLIWEMWVYRYSDPRSRACSPRCMQRLYRARKKAAEEAERDGHYITLGPVKICEGCRFTIWVERVGYTVS